MRYQVLTEREGRQLYRDSLDAGESMVEVAGYAFMPSHVLEELDPVAFSEGFAAYADALVESGLLVEGYTDSYQEDEGDLDGVDDAFVLASAGFGMDEDYGPSLAEDF